MSQPTATSTNHTPTWLLTIGIPLAIIGGIIWGVAWKRADIRVFTDSLYGMDSSHWTPAVIAGVVVLAIGAVLAVVGLVGLAVRRS